MEDLVITMPALNGRFGASGAVVRPKVCANLKVYRPSERQWKPRLRQAAVTLGESGRQSTAEHFRWIFSRLDLTTRKILHET